MKFRVISMKTSTDAHSPIQVVEQSTGKGVAWINRYLDREYVRRLADKSIHSYAHSLLHFVRWWESVHHTGEISGADLTESTLFDYVRFQSSLRPPPSASTINDRTATADRAIRNQFPDAPCQVAHGFHQPFLHRRPMGLGRPRFELSRLRIREPKLNVVPLSVDEVARFWSSFRNARDLAIVGLMLMQGLRSAEVMALIRDDVLFSEGQLRCVGRGTSYACCPWRRKPRLEELDTHLPTMHPSFSILAIEMVRPDWKGCGLFGLYLTSTEYANSSPVVVPCPVFTRM